MEFIELLFLGIGTYFDVRNQKLPMGFFLFFGFIACVRNILLPYQSLRDVLGGACIGGLFLFTGWITKEAIGYGDGLGLVILGILEGWQGMIPIVLAAFVLSGVYGMWCLIGLRESPRTEMPFYPFLLIAFMGVLLL